MYTPTGAIRHSSPTSWWYRCNFYNAFDEGFGAAETSTPTNSDEEGTICLGREGRGQVGWFTREFADAVNSVVGMKDFALETSIYVTCDETLTTDKAPEYEEKQKPQLESEKKVAGISETELCGGDVCCCQETLEDEDAIVSSDAEKSKAACCCCGPKEKEGQQDINKNSSATTLCLPDEVHIMAGRPAVRSIVQKELERALGETAVVVCGPAGLIDSSRTAVVELSDERAVHKGTGAQGIWFHAEAFSM